jgi:predicted amidophosphoribosyltransferase
LVQARLKRRMAKVEHDYMGERTKTPEASVPLNYFRIEKFQFNQAERLIEKLGKVL